jgi:hypothetical protein
LVFLFNLPSSTFLLFSPTFPSRISFSYSLCLSRPFVLIFLPFFLPSFLFVSLFLLRYSSLPILPLLSFLRYPSFYRLSPFLPSFLPSFLFFYFPIFLFFYFPGFLVSWFPSFLVS